MKLYSKNRKEGDGMKHVMKRILSLFIVAILLLSIMPVEVLVPTARAATSGTCGDNLIWTFENDTLTISLKGSETENNGMGRMEDYRYQEAPWYKLRVENLVLEEGITYIGDYAFYGLYNVEYVDIPSGVTEIGDHAFEDMGLESVTIPGTVETFGDYVFSCNFDLKHATLSEGITRVPSHAFWCCYAMTDVDLPASLTRIEDYAFSFTELSDVDIPSGVRYIGSNAFEYCAGLTSVTLTGDVQLCAGAFSNCTSLTNVCFIGVPGESNLWTKSIAINNWFRNCTSLTTLSLPTTMTSLRLSSEGGASVKTIYYAGDEDRWAAVTKSGTETKEILKNVKIHYGSICHKDGFVEQKSDVVKENQVAFQLLIPDGAGNSTPLELTDVRIAYDGVTRTYRTGQDGMLYVGLETRNAEWSVLGYEPIDMRTRAIALDKVNYLLLTESCGLAQVLLEETYGDSCKNVLVASETINLADKKQLFLIRCILSSGEERAANFQLMQGNRVIAEDALGVFSMSPDKFDPNMLTEDIYVQVRDSDGNLLHRSQRLKLNLINQKAMDESSLSFGKGIAIELDKDTPLFGGMKFELNLPMLPLNINVSGDTVRVGVNVKIWDNEGGLNKQAWAELTKLDGNLEKSVKKLTNSMKTLDKWIENKDQSVDMGGGIEMKLNVVGFLEGSVTAETLSGKLFVQFVISYQNEFGFTVIGVPCVAEIAVSGSVGAGGVMKIEAGEPKFSIDAEVVGALEAALGAGFANVGSVKVYGAGNSTWKFTLAGTDTEGETQKKRGLQEWKLIADFGVKASLLGKDIFRLKFFEVTKQIYPKTQRGYSGQQISLQSLIETAPQRACLPEIDRAYLEATSPWLGEEAVSLMGENYTESIKPLQTSVYGNVEPRIIVCDDTVMALWITDRGTGPAPDRTDLVYSLFTGFSWTEPKSVASNPTADFLFDVAADDSGIYVLWQEANGALSETDSLTSRGVRLELAVARYDPATQRFTDHEIITSNNAYEAMPALTVQNGVLYAAWCENQKGNVFGMEGTNVLHAARKSNGVWEHFQLSGTEEWVTDLDIGLIEDQIYLAYTLETDGDLSTQQDQTVYLSELDGGLQRPVQLSKHANSVQFAVIGSTPSLVWYGNGSLKQLTAANRNAVDMLGNTKLPPAVFRIISDGVGNNAVVYSVAADNRAELYACVSTVGMDGWSKPMALTKQDGYLFCADGFFNKSGDLSMMFTRTRNMETGPGAERCDLSFSVISSDSAPDLVYLGMQESVLSPDKPATLHMELNHTGVCVLENPRVTVRTRSGKVLYDERLNLRLEPGSSALVDIPVVLPPSLANETLTVVASGSERVKLAAEEIEVADGSQCEIPVGLADLSVSMEHVQFSGKNMIYATVTNQGAEPASGSFILWDQTGENQLYESSFGSLNSGEMITFITTLPEAFFGQMEWHELKGEIKTANEQYTAGNDQAYLTVFRSWNSPNSVILHELTFEQDGSQLQVFFELRSRLAEDRKPILVAAFYDAGRMVQAEMMELDLSERSWALTYTCDKTYSGCKLFVLSDLQTMLPLTEASEYGAP